MSFARPDLLFLAVLLPALVAVAVLGYARRRRRVAAALGDAALVNRIGGGELTRFPLARMLCVAGAAASLGIAAAGPRWGVREVVDELSSMNLVLALDVSRSMLVEDVAPNRLEAMRIFVRRLARDLQGDRIGLVAFAGRAYVLTPMTIDRSAIDLYIDALDPGIVSQGGSGLSSAIVQATDLARAREESGGTRVVVLLSDGEATEEEAAIRTAADRARRAGVIVHTVGIGTAMGGTVPREDPLTGMTQPVRDETGAIHVSRLDEALLRDVARRTGGRYFHLAGLGAASGVIAELGGVQRQTETQQRVVQADRYAVFIALALLLLALDALLAVDRSARWPFQLRRPASGWLSRPLGRSAALLLLCLTVTGFGIGDLQRGNRHYRAGRYAEAVEAYQAALRSGRESPELHYNLGTSLLRLGRAEEAEHHLRTALGTVEPALRQRASYNLGNRFLEAGRANPDGVPLLEAAAEAYRDALRLDPSDIDAKWNLELALRERDRQQQQQQQRQQDQDSESEEDPSGDPQQGGGQQGGGGAGAGSQGRGDRTGGDPGQLSREEADRILGAADQDELQVARERLRMGQRRTPVLRDW
jgi:Ca-activated chloride channel homolog